MDDLGGRTLSAATAAPVTAAAADEAAPPRIGILAPSDGTTRRHLGTYYWLALSALMIFTFVPGAQAALLSTILGIAEDDQGSVTGLLGVAGEITLIVVVAVSGAWSDRIGRRPVTVIGYTVMGVGLAVTPFVPNVASLVGARVVTGVGIAIITGMIATIIADYVRDETRGAANGILGAMNGVGVLITFTLLLALPDRLAAGGMDDTSALRATYLLVAGVSFLTAAMMRWGLRGGRAPQASEHATPIAELVRTGLRAGRRPGLTFSYAAAFVARADLALVGAFLILWGTQYGEGVLGLSTSEALKKGGLLVAAANGTALVVAPIAGLVSDRIGRTRAVIASMAITGVGYTSALLIDNPFSGRAYAIACLIGIGQISAVITSQVLVQEQAPPSIRGSVLGMFGLFGGIGIMIALGLGGLLFDQWRPAGPFALFGVIAFGVMALGIALQSRIPDREARDED